MPLINEIAVISIPFILALDDYIDQPERMIDAIHELVEAARPNSLASQRQLTPGVH